MGLAPIAQIRAILRRGSSKGVSLLYLAVLEVGFTLWLGYGIALPNVALILPNVVALVTTGVALVLVWRFRHRDPIRADDDEAGLVR
ncbi:MAG: hypothetical protein H0V49_13250 [Nocardioidaceae bacterium]|nr:hypothetical protein [Nocardioidaceae bacterium]